MAWSCLFGKIDSEKGCFLCSREVSAVKDFSFELLLCHAPFPCDGDAVYLYVFE